jgi:hypothetical protein
VVENPNEEGRPNGLGKFFDSTLKSLEKTSGHHVYKGARILVGTVIGTITVIFFLLKLDLLPRALYLSPSLVRQLQSGSPPIAPPTEQETPSVNLTTLPPPKKPFRIPDENRADISPKGMNAVGFALTFQSFNDADREKFAKEKTGLSIDWDLVAELDGRIDQGHPYLLCSPPHFERWGERAVFVSVNGNETASSAFLLVVRGQAINVRGKLRLTGGGRGNIAIDDAVITPQKKQ